MAWNEQEHPRDNEGKFTFKNGGAENSTNVILKGRVEKNEFQNPLEKAASILFKKTKADEELKEKTAKYKKALLDILGKDATPADILYGTTKELEKKIKDLGIGDKLKSFYQLNSYKVEEIGNQIHGLSDTTKKNFETAGKKVEEKVEEKAKEAIDKIKPVLWKIANPVLQPTTEHIIDTPGNGKYNFLKFAGGLDTASFIDLAHGEENMIKPDYLKDTIKLKNYDDPAVESLGDYLKGKVKEQFKEYGFNPETIPGYFFKSESVQSRRIIENPCFRKFIKNNKNEILKNNPELSMSFNLNSHDGFNWKTSLGKVDVKNMYLDKEGNLHLKICDTNDYNKNNIDPFNKAGYNQMKKGNLKPFFSVFDVKVPKEELDLLWE